MQISLRIIFGVVAITACLLAGGTCFYREESRIRVVLDDLVRRGIQVVPESTADTWGGQVGLSNVLASDATVTLLSYPRTQWQTDVARLEELPFSLSISGRAGDIGVVPIPRNTSTLRLVLSGRQSSAALCMQLDRCTDLQEIKIEGGAYVESLDVCDTHCDALSYLDRLASLRVVSFDGIVIHDNDLKSVQGLEHLETGVFLSDSLEGWGLCYVSKLPKLTSIEVGGCRFDAVNLECLRSLDKLEDVRIEMKNFDFAAVESICKLPQLRTLIVKAMACDVRALGRIKDAFSNIDFEILDLGHECHSCSR